MNFASFWCRLTHGTPMQPVNGRYRCRVCLREWPIPWASDKVDPTTNAIRPEPKVVTGLERASDPSREECERIFRR